MAPIIAQLAATAEDAMPVTMTGAPEASASATTSGPVAVAIPQNACPSATTRAFWAAVQLISDAPTPPQTRPINISDVVTRI
jgi:hypothetical protein